MPRIQEWIYQLEEGKFGKFLQIAVIVAALTALAVIFHVKQYSNISHPAAMDMAQVARNLSEGQGFTTDNIRPLAVHVIDRHAISKNDGEPLTLSERPRQLMEDRFPDLSHPPLFPALEALAFRILPFNFTIENMQQFRESSYRYQPEVLLSLLQTLLMVSVVLLTYALARRLFDTRIAILSAVVMLVHNYLWEAVFSGLPTLLLVNFTLVLGFFVSVMTAKWQDLSQRIAGVPVGTQMDLKEDFLHSLILLVLCGITIGLGGLADYCFLWLLVPIVALTGSTIPRWKFSLSLVPILVAAIIMAPWLIRNFTLTGMPFGLAGYSIFHSTQIFPYNFLDQQMALSSGELTIDLIFDKMVLGMNDAILHATSSIGGIWLAAFFIAGIFLPFRSRQLNNLRYFFGGATVILVLIMPLIRINYPETNGIVSPYNLAVWMTPWISIFAIACFFVITDQIELPYEPLRRGFPVLFGVLAAFPLIWNILPPNYTAVPVLSYPGRIGLPDSPLFVYDPYYLQSIGRGFRGPSIDGDEKTVADETAMTLPVSDRGRAELLMTDIPWAYAWYANRPALLLTASPVAAYNPLAETPLDGGFHRTHKPIRGLLISEMTLSRSMLDVFSLRNEGWGRFLASVMTEKEVPLGWHLMFSPPTGPLWQNEKWPFIPSKIYLADKKRWE